MKKNDLILIIVIIFACIIALFPKNEQGLFAEVTSSGKVVLKIDLSKDNEYQVEGKRGQVKMITKDKKIKVIEENSPYHLCSKQGFISKPNESIICLPNEVVITIIGESELDTIVR